ncbi:hypothetical protein EYF80_025400 [Liparis tanakae]|uniref:Uncharacterized protein n=1 Tax=Liparis tanakae TaxID=230148 RepID=A0A4Z2HEV5_9TELE|nr:hypothetical protein EYF80_025400 [Liparis tanakae]
MLQWQHRKKEVGDAEAFVVFNPGDFALLLGQKRGGGVFIGADAVSSWGRVQHVKIIHVSNTMLAAPSKAGSSNSDVTTLMFWVEMRALSEMMCCTGAW